MASVMTPASEGLATSSQRRGVTPFVMFLNFLLLGFFQWLPPRYEWVVDGQHIVNPLPRPSAVEAEFLALSLPLFAILALSLLRHREASRRRIRALGARAKGWFAALWPTPYLLAGILIIGVALLETIRLKIPGAIGWSLGPGLYVVIIFALWLCRDGLYLQWMNLRRSNHPLVMGVIFMIVFYSCSGALLAAFTLFTEKNTPYAAALVPSMAFGLEYLDWVAQRARWIAAAILIAAQALVFAFLQWRELRRLADSSAIGSAVQSPPSS